MILWRYSVLVIVKRIGIYVMDFRTCVIRERKIKGEGFVLILIFTHGYKVD